MNIVNGYIYVVSVNSLVNFEWDDLYIIEGPRFPDEIEKITNISYNMVIKDDSRQYIFVKKNKITREYSSSCRGLEFDLGKNAGLGFIKYSYSSYFKIKKRDNGTIVIGQCTK